MKTGVELPRNRREVMLIRRITLLVALTVMSALILTAQQTGNGQIQGVVKDASSAVVGGAKVTIVHTATNTKFSTTTNEVGFFLFPPAQPGAYDITVEAPGMAKWEAKFLLEVGQTAEISPVLKVGAVNTQVVIAGEVAPLVTTTNATLSTDLERARIEQLPENGRDIANLVLLTAPGLFSGQDGDINPIAYGLRDGVEMYQDGAVAKNRDTGDFGGRLPGVDSVQEVQVETSLSSAKFDRPGAIILSTRSGSNTVHGTLFETNSDSGYGVARSRTSLWSKAPHSVRNEFGGSVGLPVVIPKIYNGKNRTFFFTTYEALRSSSGSVIGQAIAPMAARQGDFSGLVNSSGQLQVIYDPYSTGAAPNYVRTPFPNNQIPVSRESPLAKYLYSVTPAPNYNANPLIAPNYYVAINTFTPDFMSTTRFDHEISEKDRLFGTFTWDEDDKHYPRDVETTDSVMNSVYNLYLDTRIAVNWTHSFSPTFLSETLFTFSREHKITGPVINPTIGNPVTYLGFPNPANDPNLAFSASSNVAYADPAGSSFNGDPPGYGMQYITQAGRLNFTDIFVVDENLTKIKGRHEIQFGARYHQELLHSLTDQSSSTATFTANATGLFNPASGSAYSAMPNTGYSAASMFLGAASSYSAGVHAPPFVMRNPEYSAYIQDNWKVKPRLTLNFGLRYEDLPGQATVGNYAISFDPKNDAIVLGRPLADMYTANVLSPSVIAAYQAVGMTFETPQQAGMPASLVKGSPWNFEPRVGFAYRMSQGQRPFVLRGGYGLYDSETALRVWDGSGGIGGSAPFAYSITNSLTNESSVTTDGLPNYDLRSVPQYVTGQNSVNVLSNPALLSILPGSFSVNYINPYQPPNLAQEWNVSLGREIFQGIIVKASYIGTHGSHLPQKYNFNQAPNSYVWYMNTGLPLPTGTYASTATEPYNQTTYGGITELEKTGYSNDNSLQLEAQRRFSHDIGFQFFYVMSQAFANSTLVANGGGPTIAPYQDYLTGAVPTNFDQLNRDLYYYRDTAIPKHSLNWNWVVGLPVGRGKSLAHNAGKGLNQVIGGWQLAGEGSYHSNYWSLPTSNWGPTSRVQVYGTKYKINDCSSGTCQAGYLYWNGYISPHLINETNAAGQCIGICGIPSNYTPADQPLIPYGTTTLPANFPANANLSSYWDTNDVWIKLNNGTVVQSSENTNYNPFQNQFFPGPWTFNLNASMFKVFPIRESVNLRFNIDFFQVLNNPGLTQPTSDGVLSLQSSNNSPRTLQLTLRLTW
jgi:hypothetical protein